MLILRKAGGQSRKTVDMVYAIIAAGEGSRLREEGITGPKPMVVVQGERLIDRLIRIFVANGASAIRVIVNDHSETLYQHLQSLQLPVPLQVIVKSTPSSFHSFYELLSANQTLPEALCLATTDTIFDEAAFAGYIDAFTSKTNDDGRLAVTSFVDDESPLYVAFDNTEKITAITDQSAATVPFVSGGIYCLRKPALAVVSEAFASGTHRMRNYQKMLLEKGLHLQAHPFEKILDVDHAGDIAKAEEFLTAIRTRKQLQQADE